MGAALVFLDTETTGLDPIWDEIWEVAAVRREVDGTETEFHTFVEHELNIEQDEPFRTDRLSRYDAAAAIAPGDMLRKLQEFIGDDRPHLVGAVPSFDAERLELVLRDDEDRHLDQGTPQAPWHYHLIDTETFVAGHLRAMARFVPMTAGERATLIRLVTAPWDSNALSLAVGVDPEQFARHTAMGDVRWAMALYDAVMG